MKLTRTAKTDARLDDAVITAALHLCAVDGGGGKTMKVGIWNEVGHLYLEVDTVGLTEFLNVVACLESFDFSDDLADANGPVHGYDALFRKPYP